MSKFLKEEIQERFQRNRNSRFGGWKGLIIKILLLFLVIHFFINFNEKSASNILWFISGGNSDYANSAQTEK